MNPRPSSARTLLVSAPASGQGKTTLTAAIARRMLREGRRVRVFKAGPDFIDPTILARASGGPVQSLDLWMVGESRCRALLARASEEADVLLIEGVMGLYDGTPSSADLARAFDIPVLAVLDASAMAQTVGAVAQGLRDYGPVRLAGVVANRIASPGHAAMVANAMRDISLLGTLPRQTRALPERHLGLVLPQEVSHLEELLDALAESLVLDEQAFLSLETTDFGSSAPDDANAPPLLRGRRIAIAHDAAFAFLYPANIACLETMGAKLLWFSPLADEPVPDDADAVYLPGGYPELHSETLARSQRWKASIRSAHARNVPMLAECGGMMAIADRLQDVSGRDWPMAGLLTGTVRMHDRLTGLGPQVLISAHGELRGHTFHHSSLETPLEPVGRTRKHPSGAEGEAIYRCGSLSASYFHAYFDSCPRAVADLFTRTELP